MSVLVGSELGTERLAQETLLLLVQNLNTALGVEDAKWTTLDKDFSRELHIPGVVCNSDKVDNRDFYKGHRPSLIEAPIDRYPNVSVMSYHSEPSGDQGDQYEGQRIRIFIEAICIDGPYDQNTDGSVFDRNGEDLVNKKTQRMAEAIHAVLIDQRTLGGYAFEIGPPPTVDWSDCMRRRESKGTGQDYYWQMVKLEYTLNKISSY